jgi:hypothetical protein
MRVIACLLTALVAGVPAAAQGWKEYAYPRYAFSVSFPADPKIETMTYQASGGRVVEARVYSVIRPGSVLRMTIADVSGASVEDTVEINHAVETLTAGGEIKADIPHRIRAVYGRQLSIAHADGSRSFVAVFYRKWRIYQIEGIALADSEDAVADAIRFQQSLDFRPSLDFAAGIRLPMGVFVRYLSALVAGDCPRISWPASPSATIPWSHAMDQRLLVTQQDAQASPMRTLNEGETI